MSPYAKDPDFVTGVAGAYEIQPPVTHPPYCACLKCVQYRGTDEWARPHVVRIRRKSPHPDSRVKSAATAARIKAAEEKQLAAAVYAECGYTFHDLCESYRATAREERKRLDRDEYRIRALEEYFGGDRDPATISKADLRAFVAHLKAGGRSDATVARYVNTLTAILNAAVKDDLLRAHQLVRVRRPKVARPKKPVTLSRVQVQVLLGPAMDAYEVWQWETAAAYNPRTHRRPPSTVPMRGLCLIAYRTLMRPSNNVALRWEHVTLDPVADTGTFTLPQHKNAKKGIHVAGALHPELVRYLRAIRPAKARGLIHPNAETGQPYQNFRRQWDKLIEFANAILPPEEQITGPRRHFYVWRATGASRLAESSRDPILVTRLMGDERLETVMAHYFDSTAEHQTREMAAWDRDLESLLESGDRAETKR